MKDEKQESEVSTEEKKNFHLKELVAAGMLVFWAYVCVCIWNQEDYNVEA